MTKITTVKESNKYTLNLKVATMEINRCMIDCTMKINRCMIDCTMEINRCMID